MSSRKKIEIHFAGRLLLFGIVSVLIMAGASLAMEAGRASLTAQAVCAMRAIGAHDPDPRVRNPDYLAEQMLGEDYWRLSTLRYHLEGMKTGRRPVYFPTLHWITARTLHIDRLLRQAVADGVRQVVVLGAGYDSRAYRLRDAMPQVVFFEVDFPATLTAKLARLTKVLAAPPDWVHYAPIDFNKQTLGDVLNDAGFQREFKTFFIWEGVTMYLDAFAVQSTLQYIARNSAPGSHVFFDYIYRSVVEGDYRYPSAQHVAQWVRSVGEPYTYGLQPYGAEPLLRRCGLSLVSDLGPKEFIPLYLAGSDGQQVGEPLLFLNLVLAKVPGEK